jgi:hypothetical protein
MLKNIATWQYLQLWFNNTWDDEPAKSTAFPKRKRAIIDDASQIYGWFRTNLHAFDIVNNFRLNFSIHSWSNL